MADEGTGRGPPSSEDPIVRWNGALRVQESFVSLDEEERLDALLTFMEDEEADIRGVAADIVAEHMADIPAAASSALVDLYSRDRDPNLRAKAADILFKNFQRLVQEDADGGEGMSSREETALMLIRDKNISVRRVAGKALTAGFDGFPPALREEAMALMARDADPWVRRAVAKTLVAHVDKLGETGLALLDQLKGDPDGWVREGLLEESSVGFDTLPDDLKARFFQAAGEGHPDDRRRALTGLAENLGRFSTQEVVELFDIFLEDEETDIRREAAAVVWDLMDHIPRDCRAGIMSTLTGSPDQLLRRTASKLVIGFYPDGDPSVRTMLLVRLMNDSDQSVRYGVLEGLEKDIDNLGPEAALSLLEYYSQDEDVWVRNLSAQILMDNLEYLGEDAIEPVLDLSMDPDVRVRRSVAQGLARQREAIPDEAGAALLERFLEDDDPFVLKTLAEMAASDWEDADPALKAHLLQSLYSDDTYIRLGAGTAVLDSLEFLPEHLVARCRDMADPATPEEVRRGFMDIFGERFPILPDWFRMDVLDKFAKDGSAWIRARAVDALNSALTPELVPLAKRLVQDLREDPDTQVKDSLAYLLLEQLLPLEKTGMKTVRQYMDPSQPIDVRVRVSAVVMRYWSIIEGDTLAFLEDMATDQSSSVRLDVFESFAEEIENMDPASGRKLLNIFCKDSNEDVRWGALKLREELGLDGRK